jgi:hypothetical protein
MSFKTAKPPSPRPHRPTRRTSPHRALDSPGSPGAPAPLARAQLDAEVARRTVRLVGGSRKARRRPASENTMGRVEDVTLPARFLTTTAHLIATLTIVYDAVRARAEPHSARVPDPPLRAARPARRSRSTETETSDVPPSRTRTALVDGGASPARARARRRGKSRHVSTHARF